MITDCKSFLCELCNELIILIVLPIRCLIIMKLSLYQHIITIYLVNTTLIYMTPSNYATHFCETKVQTSFFYTTTILDNAAC